MREDGAPVFREDMFVSELHDKYLPETYFPLVAQIDRFPRYKNKRAVDCYVKGYLDENHINEEPAWGLPTPNEEAAYKSLGKYAKDILPMTESQVLAMNAAWEMTAEHFGVYMGESRIRTVQEVMEKLDKKTSSGAPFNLKCPKKEELFDEFDFETWIEKDWDTLANDPDYTFLFTSSLKEEVRPAEKILENSIRTFLAGAVDGTVNGNRLFADMNEKMNASHLQSSSGVGMSTLKGNWDRLYRKLNLFRKGYALDESQYDSSLRAYMMWGCARLRWRMLRQEDQTPANMRRLRTYYRNLVNSLVVTAEGVLVYKLTGNPSGSVNTINDNTLILYCLLAYAWIMLCPHETSLIEFESNTAKVLVGDDNTWTVSDWAHDFFNGKAVIEVWNVIGVTTTTDSLEPRTAEQLDFLSAHTIFYRGQAVPVYDRTKLMTSLLYAPVAHHSPAVTLTRAAALLTNGWTDTQFRRFCRDFITWLIERFDKICAEDEEWILAKCGILTDERLARLFLGSTVMYAQGFNYPECRERLNPLDKTRKMIPVLQIKNKKSRSRRGKGAKATRQMRGNNRNMQNFMGPLERGPQRSQLLLPTQNRRKRRGGRNRSRGGGGGIFGAQAQKGSRGMLMKGSTVIEREEILDVVGNGTNFGVVQSLAINPGNATTFPTLSKQAVIWQRYRFKALRFEYEPTVNEFATAGTTGKVILQVNIDAADGAPTTKAAAYATDQQLMNTDLPSRKFSVTVPPRYLMPVGKDWRYVRQGGLPGQADIHEYDVANLFVSTTGTVDNSTKLGELHVYYTVQFENLLNSALEAAPINNSVTLFQSASAQTFTTATPAVSLNGIAVVNGLNAVNATGTITIPTAGNFLIDFAGQFLDSSSEALAVILELRKNGAQVIPKNFVSGVALGATDNIPISGTWFLSMVPTDNLDVRVTMTGAAGTLTGSTTLRIVAI